MEVIAKSKQVRASPRKLAQVADQIRGLAVSRAESILKNQNLKGARLILEVLKQGIGNAVNNFKLAKDNLIIKNLEISPGPQIKRLRFVSRGRVHRIIKRTSHIKMVLEAPAKEHHGAKS